MVARRDLDCRPYVPYTPYVDDDGNPPTILALAARAARAADALKAALDERASYRDVMVAAGTSARRTLELTNAIADSVATNDGRITDDE